jgi:hypothetical protein
MEWRTELHHGMSYTVGHYSEGGQQHKQPVTILREDLFHAQETTKALEAVEVRQRERAAQAGVGASGLAYLRFVTGAGGEDVGAAGGAVPDMHPAFGVGVLGD